MASCSSLKRSKISDTSRYAGCVAVLEALPQVQAGNGVQTYFAASSALYRQEIAELLSYFKSFVRKATDEEVEACAFAYTLVLRSADSVHSVRDIRRLACSSIEHDQASRHRPQPARTSQEQGCECRSDAGQRGAFALLWHSAELISKAGLQTCSGPDRSSRSSRAGMDYRPAANSDWRRPDFCRVHGPRDRLSTQRFDSAGEQCGEGEGHQIEHGPHLWLLAARA